MILKTVTNKPTNLDSHYSDDTGTTPVQGYEIHPGDTQTAIKGDGYAFILLYILEKNRLFFCINGHFCTVFLSSQDEGKQTPITSSKCVFPYTQLHGKSLSCTTKSKVVMEEEGKLVVEVQ